jgi:hypothetical protein
MTVLQAPILSMPANSAASPAVRLLLRGADVGGGRALGCRFWMGGGCAINPSVLLVRLSMKFLLFNVAGDWTLATSGRTS